MTQLTELIYTSVTSSPLSEEDVNVLLEQCLRNNAQKGITGLLCYDGVRFLQIFEGETEAVLDIYSEIYIDPRHNQVELLHEGGIETRTFSDWRMAYEALPQGFLRDLSNSVALQSLSEGREHLASAEDSFGARLFGLFMSAGLSKPLADP